MILQVISFFFAAANPIFIFFTCCCCCCQRRLIFFSLFISVVDSTDSISSICGYVDVDNGKGFPCQPSSHHQQRTVRTQHIEFIKTHKSNHFTHCFGFESWCISSVALLLWLHNVEERSCREEPSTPNENDCGEY